MRAKKIIAILLTAVTAASLLAGCGAAVKNNQTETAEQTTQVEAREPEDIPDDSEMENSDSEEETARTETAGTGGNTLVVYFSATGNTGAVANVIAGAVGGDTFELKPVQPYSDDDLDWTDDNSRVTREHENENERNVELTAETVDNWDSYGTVFIGYPIWWGIAAWPVDGFIEANDFTGKTVIPFATSSSSGMGESGELLAELAGTGEWQEGQRFRSGVSEEDVQTWVEELGLSQ
jgi:flavodoxin/outer membrane murein-binding lipoprotein Lpp